MNAMFIDILKKLTAEQGKEALLNSSKCKAFIADYTKGEYKKESRLLLQALDAGVQKAIDTTDELELCKQRQAKVLHEEHFLTAEAAADVVDTLALVLRGEQESEVSQSAFCTNCGKELQKEWGVCPYCGTPVAKTGKVFAVNFNVQTICEQGKKYLENGDYDNAIAEFNDAIRLDPNSADAYYGRGNAYKMKDQYDIAIKDFDEAIRLNPENIYIYAQRRRTHTILERRNQVKR